MRMQDFIGLDFETYSGTNLPKHGLDRYVSDPTFRPLLSSLATWNDRWHKPETTRLDYVHAPFNKVVKNLEVRLDDKLIVAHNAGFEQRVLQAIGLDYPSERFIDSAVLARMAGAAGKLEAAAPQLLGVDKMEDGRRLIMLFAVPGKYQEKNDNLAFDPDIVEDNLQDWRTFGEYCDLDAELGLRLARYVVELYGIAFVQKEMANQAVTMDMNLTGWHVDVPTVEEMQRRYIENVLQAEADFRAVHDVKDEKFFNSYKQQMDWCAERGIKAKSFDEKNVAKMLKRIDAKLDTIKAETHPRYFDYLHVRQLLETKQILGGSSLSKLQKILDTVGNDCRLRDQYLHVGAGQSYRTTGKGVQMQNLKRLSEPADMELLMDPEVEWSNDELAENIRQTFTASHPDGAIIVGDFSSVESRGLAWQAGAIWKLKEFFAGRDIYKVTAAKQFGVAYHAVTKSQRQFGKVGELSCGYQAAGGAVQSFAEGMGVELSDGEAAKVVSDFRGINPEIVQYWADLDNALRRAHEFGSLEIVKVGPDKDWKVQVFRTDTPTTLKEQHPKAQSIAVEILKPDGDVYVRRVFHGCYIRGNSLCFYKPSELKSGDLWKNHYTDQKTKQVKFYSIYGGKLAGILTQSFCREMFFDVLRKVHAWVTPTHNLQLVGQFHDEIVLDWVPAGMYGYGSGYVELEQAKASLDVLMSDSPIPGFPLAAEVKHDYRYTK